MKTDIIQQSIPNGWQEKKLGDVLDYERPDQYIVKSVSYSNKSKTPVLTANKSFILGYTDEEFGIYKNIPVIIFDDFTTDSKFVNFPFKIKSSAIKILKERDVSINLRFVFEKMKSINFQTGSHKRFYISQYQNLKILLPPLEEQQKIAEILGAVDEDIAKTQELIDTTEKLKKGLMQELFTPQNGWEEKRLGDICDIVNGSTPKRTVSEYWENGNIPWFTVEDIRSSGRIINKTNQSITDKALKETSVKLLPEDSVLLCCTASLGEVAFTKIPLTTNQQFNGLISKDKENLYPEYLFYSAQKLGESLKSKSGKTTISFLSVGTLSKEKILLPSLEEQQKIADIFSSIDEKISVNKKLKEKLITLKKGLMQDLLSGRVRVSIN